MTTLPTTIPSPLTVNVKLFSDAALQSAVDKVMANLPPDKLGFIAHADVGLDGVPTAVVSVVKRVGDHIAIEAAGIYVWGKELKAQVEFVGQL